MRSRREYRVTVMIFTESCLTPDIPECAVDMEHFHLVRADRTAESGKKRGRGRVVFVHEKCCSCMRNGVSPDTSL